MSLWLLLSLLLSVFFLFVFIFVFFFFFLFFFFLFFFLLFLLFNSLPFNSCQHPPLSHLFLTHSTPHRRSSTIRGDAPVAAHCFETALALEFNSPGYDHRTGMNKAVPQKRVDLHTPLRLRFAFEPEAEPIMRSIVETVHEQINDLDLRVYVHDKYSKGYMKKCKVSPDAWLQMALQLAYYRDQNRFAQTYEASMTRLFRSVVVVVVVVVVVLPLLPVLCHPHALL